MKKTALTLALSLAAAPAFAQQSPLNIMASFSTISAYPPPQYIVAGAIPMANGAYFGYGVTLNGSEVIYSNDFDDSVMGVVLDGPQPASIACQRLDNVTSPVTVDGKTKGKGTVTPPNDQTALYACAVYTNPAGAPVPATPPIGGCRTTQGIWNLVQAQGACYAGGGEVCINNDVPTPDVAVFPDAKNCTHYMIIHAFNANGVPNNPDCCHTTSCIAGSGCLLPPSRASCTALCGSNGR